MRHCEMCLPVVEVHWEIGVRWGRGSSAQEGLVQEMGFDLGSKKRDRVQQVGTQGEGNLTDQKQRQGRANSGWKATGKEGAWEAAEGFDSLQGGEATASQTAQGEGPGFLFCLFSSPTRTDTCGLDGA